MEELNTKENQPDENPFDTYYEKNIAPLVKRTGDVKRKYRGRFWGTLWTVLFLNSANILLSFYRHLISHHPISYEQLFLVFLFSLALIFLPVYQYHRSEKPDIFAEFLKFYNFGEYQHETSAKDEKLPIIPLYNSSIIAHEAKGKYDGVDIHVRDAKYLKDVTFKSLHLRRAVGNGTRITLQFAENMPFTLLMFDSSGFFRKKKLEGYNPVKFGSIPAANYFISFGDDEKAIDKFVRASLFEAVMDLKESSKARRMYCMIKENTMEIFLDGSNIYFDTYAFWSRSIDKNKFSQLQAEFTDLLALIEIIQTLQEMTQS